MQRSQLCDRTVGAVFLYSDLSMITPLIDAENNDRRTIDGLIIATATLSGSAVDRYRQQAANARLELDQAAGAVVWQPPVR